ncbi:MAG: PTS sugar transporter subunit IIA [Pseudomonadales bacterium]
MNDLTEVIALETTVARVPAQSRKRVLQLLSDLLAAQHADLSERAIFEALMARERLGSTGIGEGVAIPHCRTRCERIFSAFFLLEQPVDFEAPDSVAVDLVFVIVVPDNEEAAHLTLLARLAAVFNDADNRARLRSADTDSDLYHQISGMLQKDAA